MFFLNMEVLTIYIARIHAPSAKNHYKKSKGASWQIRCLAKVIKARKRFWTPDIAIHDSKPIALTSHGLLNEFNSAERELNLVEHNKS